MTNAEWCALHGWFEYGHPPLATPHVLRRLDDEESLPKTQSGSVNKDSHDTTESMMPRKMGDGITSASSTGQPASQSPGPRKRQVVDAVIFFIELDLLEIRIRELESVVDKFVILESNGTFTGHAKETVFANNRSRFNFISADRIIHDVVALHPLPPGENPFYNEGNRRKRDRL